MPAPRSRSTRTRLRAFAEHAGWTRSTPLTGVNARSCIRRGATATTDLRQRRDPQERAALEPAPQADLGPGRAPRGGDDGRPRRRRSAPQPALMRIVTATAIAAIVAVIANVLLRALAVAAFD